MGIKNLAQDLKDGKKENSEKVEKKKVSTNNKLKDADVEIPKYFETLRDEIKGKHIETKVITYIDKDLTEVLGIIKTKCKIPISSLLSHIVEEWIETHKTEIKKLPTNKYL